VNGERRTLARSPNEGWFRTAGKAGPAKDAAGGKGAPRDQTAFRFRSGDIQTWSALADARVVVYHSWETSIHRIAGIEEDTSTVVFTGPATFPFEKWGANQRYHVEDVAEALDAPGEWRLDRAAGRVSCWPREGEDMAAAEVIAPVARQLLLLEGKPAEGRFVEHVHFEGLRLLHTEWAPPPTGHSDSQAASSIPGAVQWTGARHSSLLRCEVGHVEALESANKALKLAPDMGGAGEIKGPPCCSATGQLYVGGLACGEHRAARTQREDGSHPGLHANHGADCGVARTLREHSERPAENRASGLS
jgi:hypothetical protein